MLGVSFDRGSMNPWGLTSRNAYLTTHTHTRHLISLILLLIKVIRADLGSRAQRMTFDEHATRRYFMTRQDCRNIGRKVKDFNTHRHNDDAISVDRLVGELREESPTPILAYKAQGVASLEFPLPDDTFFLVLMTDFQSKLFSDFSVKVVCLDSTHGTNQYKHKLVTYLQGF